jgi:hypothetical protein
MAVCTGKHTMDKMDFLHTVIDGGVQVFKGTLESAVFDS